MTSRWVNGNPTGKRRAGPVFLVDRVMTGAFEGTKEGGSHDTAAMAPGAGEPTTARGVSVARDLIRMAA